MRELSRARAEEYDRGLRDVSTALRNELTILISRVLAERNASVSAQGFHRRSNETERNLTHILEREHAFF
jgi:hypothetical protein